MIEKEIKWVIAQHEGTNHMYDTYLPYEFHLRMVANMARKFMHLMVPKNELHPGHPMFINLVLGAWGHDLIEDTRVSYNDVKETLGGEVAEIVYAVTNEKGKNRAERGNQKYYDGICAIPEARFIKFCDRIANVQYSKMTGSRMFEMYKKENKGFMEKMRFKGTVDPLYDMGHYLEQLFLKD
jgi:(p)ppGpp synthase/HD superfamily hydrolase